MQPTTGVFEPREDLSMRVDEFDHEMNRMGFIAHRVFPVLTRDKRSGKFPRIKLDQMLQNLSVDRTPEGYYPRSKREFSDDNYETSEKGLEALLDDATMDRYDDLIDAETFEGEVIEEALLLAYEKAVAAKLFNTGTFSGSTGALGTEWSNRSSSTPATDIDTAKYAVRANVGVKPNALVIPEITFNDLIWNTSLIDRLKAQNFQDARPGAINEAALAVSLNLDEVIVADSVYNTKMPGVDAVLGDIWDDEYALLCRVAKTNNPNERCIGRTMMWDKEGASDGGKLAVISETYYEDARRGGVLRKRTNWGLKMLFAEAGYLFSNVRA